MKFILKCSDDNLYLSKGQIALKSLVWVVVVWAVLLLFYFAYVVLCSKCGIDLPLGNFGLEVIKHPLSSVIISSYLINPFLHELAFRLPLSFKRRDVGLWVMLFPISMILLLANCRLWYVHLILTAVGVLLYWLIVKYTNDEQWERWRKKYSNRAIWFSTLLNVVLGSLIGNLLVPVLIPITIIQILKDFVRVCSITYLRLNLGFFWGLLLDALLNSPLVIFYLLYCVF